MHTPMQSDNIRLISSQSILLEMPMEVRHLPERGGDVPATVSGVVVAGGFGLVSAVARQGIPTFLASPLGTGPNSAQARYALGREGIQVLVAEVVGDNGLRICQLEPDGIRTTITAPGVEAEPSAADLAALDLGDGDCIYLNTNDLVYESSARVLGEWVCSLPAEVKLFVSTGGMIEEVEPDLLQSIIARADLFTANRRESRIVTSRLGEGPAIEVFRRHLPAHAILVMRDGQQGCTVQADADATPVGIPAFEAKASDTSAVGDAHTGVLVASLLLGHPLTEAARRANAAASITLTRRGHAVAPSAREIDKFLAEAGH